MYKQLSILQDMMGFVHRIGPEQLLKDLPAKHEHVVLVCLDAAQQRMYQAYLDVSLLLCLSVCLSVSLAVAFCGLQGSPSTQTLPPPPPPSHLTMAIISYTAAT